MDEKFNKYWDITKKNRLICFLHGKKYLIQELFHARTKQNLDFNSISTFSEKLQLRKLYKNPLMLKCIDKNAVREYVKIKIGEEYLVPQYFCKKRISLKDLEALPDSFILKTTSGSGENIVVRNKQEEDLQKLCQTMNNLVKIKYGYVWGEFFYNLIDNQIIAEKLLTKDEVLDYKIHCFRDDEDKLRQIIEVLWGEKGDRHKKMYDQDWKPLSYFFSLPPEERTIKKPKQLKKLLELAAKLSEDFNYVRVDFYVIKGHIYFGELTFTPKAGFGKFTPAEYDKIWGSWIRNNFTKEDT